MFGKKLRERERQSVMTLYPPQILHDLNSHHIFLDTGVFITASKSESFVDFLVKLKNDANCSLTTIPSVVFEFTNGSESLEKYNARTESLNSLVDSVNPVTFLNNIQDFYVVMAKINDQNKSYTDFLLAACLYNYRRSKIALLTTDLKAFPSFYPRTHVVTVEQDRTKAIINLAIYKFDGKGYASAAERALRENKSE